MFWLDRKIVEVVDRASLLIWNELEVPLHIQQRLLTITTVIVSVIDLYYSKYSLVSKLFAALFLFAILAYQYIIELMGRQLSTSAYNTWVLVNRDTFWMAVWRGWCVINVCLYTVEFVAHVLPVITYVPAMLVPITMMWLFALKTDEPPARQTRKLAAAHRLLDEIEGEAT